MIVRACLVLSATLLLLPGALAQAACGGPVCVGESSAGDDCATTGGRGYHYDRVAVRASPAWATVEGSEDCWTEGTWSGRSSGVAVSAGVQLFVGVQALYVEWSEHETTDGQDHAAACGIAVRPMLIQRPPVSVDQPCLVGPPPNPGWGALLP